MLLSTSFRFRLRFSLPGTLPVTMSPLRVAFLGFILAFVPFLQIRAQSIALRNLDTRNFPRIQAEVFAFDAQGRQILMQQGLTVTEDGIPRTITSYSCPPQPAKPVSVVLAIDISGSMVSLLGVSNTTRMSVAKQAASAFVNAVADDGSETAVLAFDDNVYLQQDFTTDKFALNRSIDMLSPRFGTNFQRAFLNQPGGALRLFSTAKHQDRALIFLTDGLADAMPSEIIALARQFGVKIYCITIGLPVPRVLDDVARGTGGESFSNVQSTDEAVLIYRNLANRLRFNQPCAIEWVSDIACRTQQRTVELRSSVLPPNVVARTTYLPPSSVESQVRFEPSTLRLGTAMQGSQAVTMRVAANSPDVRIRSITSSDPTNFSVSVPAPGVPRTLPANTTLAITVRSTATDSSFRFAAITVETESGCVLEFYATSGFPGLRPRVPTLQLVRPNGGEVFLVGTTANIAWRGVPADEKVILDYSIDNGRTWRNIDSNAVGLSRPWLVPNTPSDICLMRVRQKNTTAQFYTGDSATALIWHRAGVNSAKFNTNGTNTRVAAAGEGFGSYWNIDSINIKTDPVNEFFFSSERNRDISDATFTADSDLLFGCRDGNAPQLGFATNSGLEQRVGLGQTIAFGSRAAIRNIDANPSNARRFIFTTTNPRVGITTVELGSPNRVFSPTLFLTSDDAQVRNARYTKPFGVSLSNGQSVNAYGVVAALEDSRFPVRLWLFLNRDETQLLNNGLPLRWQSNQIPEYVDAALVGNSNLRIAVACGDNVVRFLQVVADGNNPRLEEESGMAITNLQGLAPIRMLSFTDAGDYMAVVSGKQVFIYFVAAGVPVLETVINAPGGRAPHQRDINTAFFNRSGSLLVTASNDTPNQNIRDTNLVVWFLREKLPLQTDQSDAVWRIVRPRLVANNIDMGKVAVGTTKDSTALALTNPDPFAVPITRIFFKKPNSPFSVMSNGAPLTVSALGRHNIEFRFAPLSTVQADNIDSVFYESLDGVIFGAEIRGEGIVNPINLSASTTSIDWGERVQGTPHDTIQAVFRNTGSSPLTFPLPRIALPSIGLVAPFEFLGVSIGTVTVQNDIVTVPPNGTLIIYARFTPPAIGRFSAPLEIKIREQGVSFPTVMLFGTGIMPGPLISAPSLADSIIQRITQCTPQSVAIPIRNTGTLPLVIQSAAIEQANGIASTEFTIIGATPQTIPVGETATIRVQFSSQRIGTSTATLVLRTNSSGSPETRIGLIGLVERPQLVIDRRFVVFDAVEAGEITSATVVVRNTGNTPLSWFPAPITFDQTVNGQPVPRMRVSASPALPTLPPQSEGRLTLTFLGGAAGLTYTDRVVMTEGCFADSIQWSATVKSAPALVINAPTLVSTCESSATITLTLQNTGTAPAETVSMSLQPPLPNVRITPASPLQGLAPGASRQIQVTVSPLQRADTTRFSVIFRSTNASVNGQTSASITIAKRDVGFDIQPRSIVFSGLQANMSADTLITIRNMSSEELPMPMLRPPFTLLAPQTIAPYSSLTVRVAMSGVPAGQTRIDTAVFAPTPVSGTGCAVQPISLALAATALVPSVADLVFENIVGSPGDTVSMRVWLRNRVRIAPGMVITDTLRYNFSLLMPLAPLPVLPPVLAERIVPVRFVVNSTDENVPLATLRFLAALGNDTTTVLRLTGTPQNRTTTPFTTINATPARFILTGIARAGGIRLIITGTATMRVNDIRPNPVSSDLTVDLYSEIADEYNINIITLLGVRLSPTIFTEQRFTMPAKSSSSRALDVSRIPPGTYFLQVRNSRELVTRRILIVR